jgi:hypothetical protein
VTATIDTSWWEAQDPGTFLFPNWDHPSRAIGTAAAIGAVGHGSLVEVGPGAGVDYARAFRPLALTGDLQYVGWEATALFCAALRRRYPEAAWHHAPLQHLLPASCDVIYARAVLEHQADPLAALATLLAAARVAVVIDWYRPPAERASCDYLGSVPCHTVDRGRAAAMVDMKGYVLAGVHAIAGNEVWHLERAS